MAVQRSVREGACSAIHDSRLINTTTYYMRSDTSMLGVMIGSIIGYSDPSDFRENYHTKAAELISSRREASAADAIWASRQGSTTTRRPLAVATGHGVGLRFRKPSASTDWLKLGARTGNGV